MAKFYGQVRGRAATTASREGSEASGIKVSAQSWNGSVIVELDYDANGNLIVKLSVSDGSAFSGDMLFRGTFEDFKSKF